MAAIMYSLGTWFVSGICVCITYIKETTNNPITIIIIIIIIIKELQKTTILGTAHILRKVLT